MGPKIQCRTSGLGIWVHCFFYSFYKKIMSEEFNFSLNFCLFISPRAKANRPFLQRIHENLIACQILSIGLSLNVNSTVFCQKSYPNPSLPLAFVVVSTLSTNNHCRVASLSFITYLTTLSFRPYPSISTYKLQKLGLLRPV